MYIVTKLIFLQGYDQEDNNESAEEISRKQRSDDIVNGESDAAIPRTRYRRQRVSVTF